jgi:hypothetical protein
MLFPPFYEKMVKIRIKPKISYENVETATNERERERQEEYCDEFRKLRSELETMKTAMDEMRRDMNEMQTRLQSGRRPSCHDNRSHPDPHDINFDHNCHHNCDNSSSDFGKWISGLELTRQDLETMFESSDVIDWASKFIVADLKQRSGHPYPLCVIKGSRNEMLIYDNNVWKKMTDQEFASRVMNKMFKKLLAVFTAWKNENYNKILTSEHFSTLYHSNYARILSFNENASKLKTKLFHALLLP